MNGTIRNTSDDNYVLTDRGGVIENAHQVHVAVTDSTGKLLFHVGDPSRITLIRSAAKPAQALAAVETGGFEQCGFEDRDLALMCASHNSEPRHIERTRAMLRKVGAQESDLRCGGHPSISPDVIKGWVRDSVTPTAVYSNCSGKHAGMLAGAKALGVPLEDYHKSEHPIQQRVMRVVEEVAGLPKDQIQWGLDGCNMPAPAYPLDYLAKTYAYFAGASDWLAQSEDISSRTKWSGRIFNAMSQYPEQVAGEGRFDTILMNAYGRGLIGKLGADACYGIGVRASEATKRLGAEGALGIGIKIGDGNLDILYATISEVLERLQIGSDDVRRNLDKFHHLRIVNTMGVETGKVHFPFVIRAENGSATSK